MVTTHSTKCNGLTENQPIDEHRDQLAHCLESVLWNDPATGGVRHADAGFDFAVDCAKEQGLKLPGITM